MSIIGSLTLLGPKQGPNSPRQVATRSKFPGSVGVCASFSHSTAAASRGFRGIGTIRPVTYVKSLKILCWLVVGPPLWKIWKSIGMISNPIDGKIKNGNQTTNQLCVLWRNENHHLIFCQPLMQWSLDCFEISKVKYGFDHPNTLGFWQIVPYNNSGRYLNGPEIGGIYPGQQQSQFYSSRSSFPSFRTSNPSLATTSSTPAWKSTDVSAT